MSRTEIYTVSPTSCNRIGETRNAHRGAMYVWNDMARRYFKFEMFPIFDESQQRRVWNAHNEHALPEHEKIVLLSTMDNVTVKKENLPSLVWAFEKYGEEHPNSSLKEQSEVIKNAEIADGELLGFNQTSVCSFNLGPSYDEETEEPIYNDLSEAWDLFEQLSKING